MANSIGSVGQQAHHQERVDKKEHVQHQHDPALVQRCAPNVVQRRARKHGQEGEVGQEQRPETAIEFLDGVVDQKVHLVPGPQLKGDDVVLKRRDVDSGAEGIDSIGQRAVVRGRQPSADEEQHGGTVGVHVEEEHHRVQVLPRVAVGFPHERHEHKDVLFRGFIARH